MKQKSCFYLLLALILSVIPTSCDEKEEGIPKPPDMGNYDKAILGKWQLIEQGMNINSMEPIINGNIWEFLSIGKRNLYDYQNQSIPNSPDATYKIGSVDLYVYYPNYIEKKSGTAWFHYNYELLAEDEMRLTYLTSNLPMLDIPAPTIFLLKQIK